MLSNLLEVTWIGNVKGGCYMVMKWKKIVLSVYLLVKLPYIP